MRATTRRLRRPRPAPVVRRLTDMAIALRSGEATVALAVRRHLRRCDQIGVVRTSLPGGRWGQAVCLERSGRDAPWTVRTISGAIVLVPRGHSVALVVAAVIYGHPQPSRAKGAA